MRYQDRYRPPEDLATGDSVYQRYRPLIDDWEAFCRTLEQPLRPCLRANTTRTQRSELMQVLQDEGIAPEPVPWHPEALTVPREARPGRHWGAIAGVFQIQEAASLLPVSMLDVQPGERVLDLCAAPGNKTVQLAEELGNRGTVVANDASRGRHAALSQALKRHGILNTSQTARDGQGMPWASGRFDKVLVDAPCSCEGTFRKTATAAEPVSADLRERLARKQRRILRRGMALTRPGGLVVYATCTFAPEENEAVVANALERFGGAFELLPARLPGVHLAPGVTEWQGARYGPELERCGRLWPHHNDTGGFFVALLRRVAGGEVAPDPEPLAGDPQARDLLRIYEDELGVPGDVLDGLTPFLSGRKYVRAAASDHTGAGDVPVVATGIPAARAQRRFPKPATAGAMALGRYARERLLEVDREEAEGFFRRQALFIGPERDPGPSSGGLVLVRHRGFVLGVGLRREAGVVVSLFPKAWSRAAYGEDWD